MSVARAAAIGIGAIAIATLSSTASAPSELVGSASVIEVPPPATAPDRSPTDLGPLARPPTTLANTASSVGGAIRWSETISQAGAVAGVPEPGDLFASAIAVADLNNDGIDDVIIGSPHESVGSKNNTGAITLVPGGTRRFQLSPTWPDAKPSETHNQGGPMAGARESGDRFGAAVAIGDFDGDATFEIVVGAPGEDVGGVRRAGAVTIVPSSETGLVPSASFAFSQTSPPIAAVANNGDQMGAALAVGDFDGDGIDDLAIGIPGDKVASSDNAGSVLVVPGSGSGLRLDAAARFDQATVGVAGRAETGDRFGASVAAGDVNGDGRDDLIVGIPGEDRAAGAFAILYGTPTGIGANGASFNRRSAGVAGGRRAGDRLGTAVAAGDLNDDGFADIAVAAPFDDHTGAIDAGSINIFFGSPTGPRVDNDLLVSLATKGIAGAPAPRDNFGGSLTISNVSGSRHDDLVIGVPGRTVGSSRAAGAISVIRGANKGITAKGDQLITGATAGIAGSFGTGDRLGEAVATGDLNGDGRADVLAGAPRREVNGRADSGALVSLDARNPAPVVLTDRRDDRRGKQVHVIYAIPADRQPERAMDDAIRTDVAVVDEWFTGQLGGQQVRWDTIDGALDLSVVFLEETEAEIANGDDAFNVLDAIDSQGFNDPRKLYLVYYEGEGTRSTVCGVTFSFFISILWLDSCGGVYPSFTTFPFGATYLAVHELTHGFGAVDACAPNDDGTGHVLDDRRDVLYQGPLPRDWANLTLDPGNDDYYRHGRASCTDIATTGYFS